MNNINNWKGLDAWLTHENLFSHLQGDLFIILKHNHIVDFQNFHVTIFENSYSSKWIVFLQSKLTWREYNLSTTKACCFLHRICHGSWHMCEINLRYTICGSWHMCEINLWYTICGVYCVIYYIKIVIWPF